MGETPPPPPAEKRGAPEYTHSHVSTGHEEKQQKNKQIRIVEEMVEDVEENIKTLCGKIQKFYPSRWEKAVSNGNKTSTMAANFQRFLEEIEDIRKENPDARISQKWENRVAEYQQDFQTKIKQHL